MPTPVAEPGKVRPPAVAGRFYPSDSHQLRSMVQQFIGQAEQRQSRLPRAPRAIVAPHAGYVFSGPIAGAAYASIKTVADAIDRVVILGPAHRVAFSGIATSSAAAFDCPLGRVTLDSQAIGSLEELPFVHRLDEAHAEEHGLEVQLPFLIELLGEFQLVPLVVGDAPVDQVQQVIEMLWDQQGPGESPSQKNCTLFVVSTDLSHYLDYHTARAMDRETTQAIERLAPESISPKQACGSLPLRAMLTVAQEKGLQALTLDLRNSGDTAGPRNQVVGYGAYAFV